MSTITKTVSIERNGKVVVAQVTISLPDNLAEDMYVDERMILETIAAGQRRVFSSRHNDQQTIVSPVAGQAVSLLTEVAALGLAA